MTREIINKEWEIVHDSHYIHGVVTSVYHIHHMLDAALGTLKEVVKVYATFATSTDPEYYVLCIEKDDDLICRACQKVVPSGIRLRSKIMRYYDEF